MQDAQIVALMAAGDRAGLEAAYDAYADRLHDYARSMLRSTDPETAADVTHDTFLVAFAKASDLRKPERLRPWLYAITRNECLRVLRRSRRTTELDDDAVMDERGADMSASLDSTDLKQLVHAAAAGLSPKDREVFDLGLRHDLAASEIAAALGVSDNVAHAMLSRVKSQLARALGAFVVARDRSCPDLVALLAGWDGEFSPLWRKRIARHTDSCATCAGVQDRELSPAALLSVAPIVAAPTALRSRLFSDEIDLVAQSRVGVNRGVPFDSEGFPVPPVSPELYEIAPGRHRDEPPARHRRGGLVIVAALLAGIIGFGAVQLLRSGQTPVVDARDLSPTIASVTIAPTPTLTEGEPRASKTPSATPTPTPTTTAASPTPRPTRTPTPRPTGTPRPSPTRTSDPPPAAGTLAVSPRSLTLARRGAGSTGTVSLAAVDGAVDWTASAPEGLFVDNLSGHLDAGESTTVQITVDPSLPPGTYTFSVVFSPGNITVSVAVP